MSKSEAPTVFVIDDDAALCESLQWLLESEGYAVCTFASADAFLDAYTPDRPGCILLDVRLHGTSGMELQARLNELGAPPPIIMITGHGDVPAAVRALKAGALDFLQKPVDDQLLLDRVRQALAVDARQRAVQAHSNEVSTRTGLLTPREREVMQLLCEGRSNKQIGRQLCISERTVEVHRKRVLQKMEVHSVVELVRLLAEASTDLSSPSDASDEA